MKKIAIIGGGIGGLALANAFQKNQIDYQLFKNAPQFGEVGAGIGISESTIEILDHLGLKNKITGKGKYIKEAVIVDNQLNIIRKLPLQNGGFCINRSLLIDALSENIHKDKVSFNHKVTGIQVNDNINQLTFQNGLKYEFEAVIACDGINSIIRKKLFPTIRKRYSGQTIWRGIASCKLPERFQDTYFEFWGDNLRFATIPLNPDEYYWYAVSCAKAGEQDNLNTIREDLKKLFRNFIFEISTVIDTSPEIIRNDMWDLSPSNRVWHYKNVVFLGDAVHATTPNLAQGGCQAIEDAYTLTLLIKKYGVCQPTFEKYRNLRQEKVNYIVNQSWNYGNLSHQSKKWKRFIVKQLFKKILPNSFFTNQYKKLIDIEYFKGI